MKNNVKRIVMIVTTIILLLVLGTYSLGTNENIDINLTESFTGHSDETVLDDGTTRKENMVISPVLGDSVSEIENNNEVELNSASDSIINSTTKKERRIAELTDKYNDKVYATVAYYLELVQKYSFPICFIGIAMGAFNFLIIGNKKLDKKEQGFGWIVGFTIGLVVFNVIPLIFALIVAGR